jgi:HPt (histidine-containing phosphotransfer) domain-containing protein
MEGESGSPIASDARAWLRLLAETAPAGRDEVRVLVRLFIDDARTTIARLHGAAADADLDLVRVLAHNLRGSSATFGANEVAEICRHIDELADGGGVPAVHAAMPALDTAMSAASGALAAEFLAEEGGVSSPSGG